MGERTNWFRYIHSYNRVVRAGMTKPLTCPDDDYRYQTVIKWEPDGTVNDIPRLFCPYCNALVTPGLDMLEQIRAVVKEHTYD